MASASTLRDDLLRTATPPLRRHQSLLRPLRGTAETPVTAGEENWEQTTRTERHCLYPFPRQLQTMVDDKPRQKHRIVTEEFFYCVNRC